MWLQVRVWYNQRVRVVLGFMSHLADVRDSRYIVFRFGQYLPGTRFVDQSHLSSRHTPSSEIPESGTIVLRRWRTSMAVGGLGPKSEPRSCLAVGCNVERGQKGGSIKDCILTA
jgi:hypothetical protein